MRQTEKLYLDVTSTMSTYPRYVAACNGVSLLVDEISVCAPSSRRTFSQQQCSKTIPAFATADAVQPKIAGQAYKKRIARTSNRPA